MLYGLITDILEGQNLNEWLDNRLDTVAMGVEMNIDNTLAVEQAKLAMEATKTNMIKDALVQLEGIPEMF